MGCATGVVKYFVFIANLIFALAGLTLIAIGVMYKIKYGAATNALPTDFGLAPVLSIIIGCIVFVTATLGCCGAIRESPCMLVLYSIILITIFLVQLGIGVYAFLKIKDERGFHEAIEKALAEPFHNYKNNHEAQETTDVIQKLLSCCGVNRPEEYEKIFPNNTLPLSCCPRRTSNTCMLGKNEDYFHHSCANSLYRLVMDNATIVGGTVIGIGIVELLGVFLGLCLASSVKNQYRRSLYA